MAVAWTEEQKKVIDLRDRNILVAAAAGSGKTAVLVERILSRIMDPVDPVSVDELLIVTFTKAAATQMRERIGGFAFSSSISACSRIISSRVTIPSPFFAETGTAIVSPP